VRITELIQAYRVSGHMAARLDPLGRPRPLCPDLDPGTYGLGPEDLDTDFAVEGLAGRRSMTLREILIVLQHSYCGSVGAEYTHVQDPAERAWLRDRLESPPAEPAREERSRILDRLGAAEAMEAFLHTKYVGQKRYSLEGGESVIVLLDALLGRGAALGVREAVIGMAHRGRLNVLANIAGKPYAEIFREFEDFPDAPAAHGSGDVKYHLGSDGTYRSPDGSRVAGWVGGNPTHLEIVAPVAQGVARARQELLAGADARRRVLPVVLHGDAAFTGQGVAAETLNLSRLAAYGSGGSVHIVIDNQVGFTTDPASARSGVYASDPARAIGAPILHVNGDDPEAVARVARLAADYRDRFGRDLVIHVVCYRRHGHSEVDDPSVTQPVLYDEIDARLSVRALYAEKLVRRGQLTAQEVDQARHTVKLRLEEELEHARRGPAAQVVPAPLRSGDEGAVAARASWRPTAVGESGMNLVLATQNRTPEGFSVHPRVQPQLKRRSVEAGELDWAGAETLAIGALLADGVPVRLAGQDSRRGTFGQRHAVLVDRLTGAEHTPLSTLGPGAAAFTPVDSPLSEMAVLAFEYGYSLSRPDGLVIWEAQFGDFANGAQTVFDQYISSAAQKWGLRSSLAVLLPHGLEGQGPDHSSARVERFLQLCAQDNMTVAMPSSPANYFHLLRAQGLNVADRPLVVFAPKSMLRAKAARSPLTEFSSGTFRPVIGDRTVQPDRVRRVLVCAGKLGYELEAFRAENEITGTAVVRLERFYPFPVRELRDELARYPRQAEVFWVQEEPENQGASAFVTSRLVKHALPLAGVISRPEAASTATGSARRHRFEQEKLVRAAFGVDRSMA
jgi:2-oxoglutarate decarboxylase